MAKNIGFWGKLKKPFFILAPMADVTDSAFRQIVIECGRSAGLTVNKPDVFYTEFISCTGLCSEKGKPKLMPHLKFSEKERPIVAQFFGANPKNFFKCAQLAVELGFDGVDINMGCPDRKVLKQGGGAALILEPKLAKEIIKATQEGAGSLPVSIKTRLGFNTIITEEWITNLVAAEPTAIVIHGRTKKEMSKVPAHWDEIGKAAGICRKAGVLVVGNGDVAAYTEGIDKAKQYGLDGIMVGRGIFSNPWFFDPSVDHSTKTPEDRIDMMMKHIKIFIELWGTGKHFDAMKKFFKIYISGWVGAKELRSELMKTKNEEEVAKCLKNYPYGLLC